jgi:H+-transporting ATPase
VHFALLTDLL